MKTSLRITLCFLLAVTFAPSLNGAPYNQNVLVLPQQQTSATGPSKLLCISATVDGSDKISFTSEGVCCEHKWWSPMTDVLFNGKPWKDLAHAPAGWLRFSRQLDLTKAHIVNRKGRDVIALESTPNGFDLYLDDSPNGAADYSVTISIPYRN